MSDEKKVEARKTDPIPDYNEQLHGPNWWRTGPWKPPVPVDPLPDTEANKYLRTVMSPNCKHYRVSQTIVECEECRRYTESLNAPNAG